MQQFVVDANIIISILISGKASYKPIFTLLDFYTPDFALEELEKYKPVIFEKTKLKPEELRVFTFFVFERISVIPNLILTDEALIKATDLVQNIDIKDVSYVALSLQLDLVLLTRDKQLVQGLKRKGFRKAILFEEFLTSL